MSLQNTKSEAGEQFLPLDCRAKAARKGMFFSQTPVSFHPTAFPHFRHVSSGCQGTFRDLKVSFVSLSGLSPPVLSIYTHGYTCNMYIHTYTHGYTCNTYTHTHTYIICLHGSTSHKPAAGEKRPAARQAACPHFCLRVSHSCCAACYISKS